MPDPDAADEFADLDALVTEAAGLPHGAGKVAVLERAVTLADTKRDEWLGFHVRQELLWPAYHGSRPDLVLVHFAWCLAYLDRNPDQPPFETLWQYRWVVDTMPNFAAVSRPQIEAAWDDMRRRYAAGGWSLRPVWLNRRRIMASMGDTAAAADAHRRYVRCRRDPMSDAPAQDAAFAVDYADFLRKDALTIRLGRAHLADPRSDAQDVIQAADDTMMALLRRGLWAEAKTNFDRANRHLARNRQFYGSTQSLLVYLAVTGELAAAAKFFDKDFPAAVTEPGEFGWLASYKAGLYLARRLSDAGRKVVLKVPAGFVPGVPGDRVTPAQLRDHLEAATPALAAQEDARNGNAFQAGRLADLAEFAALAARFTRSQP